MQDTQNIYTKDKVASAQRPSGISDKHNGGPRTISHRYAIVWKFKDVFPNNLSGFPLEMEVEFNIELAPEIMPMSRMPYRMASLELQEIKS